MKGKTALLAFLAILFVATAVFAASDFTLQASNSTPSVDPGKTATVTFVLNNTGNDTLRVTDVKSVGFIGGTYNLTQGMFSTNAVLTDIPNGTAKTFNLTIAPGFAEVGTYSGSINVTVRNSALQTLSKTFSLDVSVNLAYNASMSDPSPVIVVSGKEKEFNLTVTNTGNSHMVLDFQQIDIMNGMVVVGEITFPPQDYNLAFGKSLNVHGVAMFVPSAEAKDYHVNVVGYAMTDLVHPPILMNKSMTVTSQAVNEVLTTSATVGAVKVSDTQMTKNDPIIVTLKNDGNVKLDVSLTLSDLTSTSNASNKMALAASSASFSLETGATKVVNLTAVSAVPAGTYAGVVKISYNGKEKNVSVSSVVSASAVGLEVPASVNMPSSASDRNKSVSATFTVKNTGDTALSNVEVKATNVDSKYNVLFSVDSSAAMGTVVISSIDAGATKTVTVSGFIPDDETASLHSIGTINVGNDKVSKTSNLKVYVASKLKISEVNFRVSGGSNRATSDGDGISDKDALPGESYSIDVKVCNDNPTGSDNRIDNIQIKATWSNVDDGDDIEGDVSEFDLDGNKCVTKTLNMDKNTIPSGSSGNYDLVIDVDGESRDGDTDFSTSWTVPVEIFRKDGPYLKIEEASLSQSTVACGNYASLNVVATNIGDSDDQGVLKIVNSALGIDEESQFDFGTDAGNDCDAAEDTGDDCIGVDHTYSLEIPANAAAGAYTLTVTTYSDDGSDKNEEKTVSLTVTCSKEQSTSSGTSSGTSGSTTSGSTSGSSSSGSTASNGSTTKSGSGELEVLVGTGSGSTSTGGATAVPTQLTDTSSMSFTSNTSYMALLVIANLVVLSLVVIGVSKLFL